MMPGLSQKDCFGGRGSEVEKMPPSACQELRYDSKCIIFTFFEASEAQKMPKILLLGTFVKYV